MARNDSALKRRMSYISLYNPTPTGLHIKTKKEIPCLTVEIKRGIMKGGVKQVCSKCSFKKVCVDYLSALKGYVTGRVEVTQITCPNPDCGHKWTPKVDKLKYRRCPKCLKYF